MSRIHGHQECAHVRCHEGRPEQFIWHDRLYRVHRVLQEWERSASWWTQHALAAGPAQDVRTWRVEASAGRSDEPGVYDLSFDPARAQWRLVRTFD
jgi:hypothetical protein